MVENKTITSADIMLTLCDSTSYVMNSATNTQVQYTPMVQKITQTTLRPDIGTFVLFTGSFSGMVVINFPKETAMELYTNYMTNLGMRKEELAQNYTSEDVSNCLGELMNQILGHFTAHISNTLHTAINQSQPKMLSLPHEVQISINMSLDNPVIRRVTFSTASGNVFYVELAMDDTEFTAIREFEEHAQLSPDEILAQISGI